MNDILQLILDWSEVWAPVIPLFILLFCKQQPNFCKPVVVYLIFALVINLSGNIIADYKNELHLPEWLRRNTFLYNMHSIWRYTCFTWFFVLIKVPFVIKFGRYISTLLLLFIIINFSVIEEFNSDKHLSGHLLTIEAFFLLIYCVSYYLYNIQEEQQGERYSTEFWIVTGLSIYVVINFFIFLLYVPMINNNLDLADRMWDIHNIAYIILCMLLAKAFCNGR